MTARTDAQSLAFEILGMSYGELSAVGFCLSDIIANTEGRNPTGPEMAAHLHAWATDTNGTKELPQ